MSTRASALFARHKPKSPGFHFALAAVVALLILSLWLHFFLALEIEGLGRDIDAKTEELERLQRANLATMYQITVLESQSRMGREATAMGFRPQQPLYLAISQPLLRPASQAGEPTYLSIWTVGPGRTAADAQATQALDETAEPAMSVANVP